MIVNYNNRVAKILKALDDHGMVLLDLCRIGTKTQMHFTTAHGTVTDCALVESLVGSACGYPVRAHYEGSRFVIEVGL